MKWPWEPRALPKVLILEDDFRRQKAWADQLSTSVEILQAYNLQKADVLWQENRRQIRLMIIDACVPGHMVNTDGFVKRVRSEGYKGPMIATSSMDEYMDILCKAGCDHKAEKSQVVEKVLQILGVTDTAG